MLWRDDNCHQGNGVDGVGEGNYFGCLILIYHCMQIRALRPLLDSLACGAYCCLQSCLAHMLLLDLPLLLSSANLALLLAQYMWNNLGYNLLKRRGYIFHVFGCTYREHCQKRTNNFPDLPVTLIHLSNVQHFST